MGVNVIASAAAAALAVVAVVGVALRDPRGEVDARGEPLDSSGVVFDAAFRGVGICDLLSLFVSTWLLLLLLTGGGCSIAADIALNGDR